MAYKDLEQFLRNLSKDPDFRAAYQKDKQQTMSAAGLSPEEQALVLGGDKEAIRKYMGETYGAAQMIEIP